MNNLENVIANRHVINCAKGARVTNSKRSTCSECGFTSTPAGLSLHRKHSGHESSKIKYNPITAGRKGGKKGAAVVNSRKYICLDCGKISTPGGIANHCRFSGHIAYEEYYT